MPSVFKGMFQHLQHTFATVTLKVQSSTEGEGEFGEQQSGWTDVQVFTEVPKFPIQTEDALRAGLSATTSLHQYFLPTSIEVSASQRIVEGDQVLNILKLSQWDGEFYELVAQVAP